MNIRARGFHGMREHVLVLMVCTSYHTISHAKSTYFVLRVAKVCEVCIFCHKGGRKGLIWIYGHVVRFVRANLFWYTWFASLIILFLTYRAPILYCELPKYARYAYFDTRGGWGYLWIYWFLVRLVRAYLLWYAWFASLVIPYLMYRPHILY